MNVETDRAVDPIVETQVLKTKQPKKTKGAVKTNKIEEVASKLEPISHSSHGTTPGEASHAPPDMVNV